MSAPSTGRPIFPGGMRSCCLRTSLSEQPVEESPWRRHPRPPRCQSLAAAGSAPAGGVGLVGEHLVVQGTAAHAGGVPVLPHRGAAERRGALEQRAAVRGAAGAGLGMIPRSSPANSPRNRSICSRSLQQSISPVMRASRPQLGNLISFRLLRVPGRVRGEGAAGRGPGPVGQGRTHRGGHDPGRWAHHRR